MKNNIICDECSKEFSIRTIKSKKINKELKHNFLQCPRCKKKFTVNYENKELNEILTKLKILKIQIDVEIDAKKLELLFAEQKALSDKRSKIIADLDKIYNN